MWAASRRPWPPMPDVWSWMRTAVTPDRTVCWPSTTSTRVRTRWLAPRTESGGSYSRPLCSRCRRWGGRAGGTTPPERWCPGRSAPSALRSGRPLFPLTCAAVWEPDRPLRIGYISPDLFTHSVSYFAEAPLTHHSPARGYQHYVYSCVPKPDPKTVRLRAATEAAGGVWRDVARLNEAELAELVRRDEIDLLVELTAFEGNSSAAAAAAAAAAVRDGLIRPGAQPRTPLTVGPSDGTFGRGIIARSKDRFIGVWRTVVVSEMLLLRTLWLRSATHDRNISCVAPGTQCYVHHLASLHTYCFPIPNLVPHALAPYPFLGHTANNRLGVMARRPAPVQLTWIGYPNSTGLKAVDYRLTDDVCDPWDTKQTFVEELVRLPGCFLCYSPAVDAPPVAPAPALANGYITFGSFNNLAKITPQVLRIWGAVLAAVPRSRLVLKNKPFACEAARGHVLQQLAAVGVESWRVDLLPLAPGNAEHLATYALMDISLDPFPYAGYQLFTGSCIQNLIPPLQAPLPPRSRFLWGCPVSPWQATATRTTWESAC
ncbi:hypothetical protein Vafri_9837 [Volvox africanus]|uniref:O-GlcNAc transferase C-terminal domain-containing protein n=1 Tax=Volvox africanus TaxID=51714 RepID=A0A8J4B524_9CHLO|nr:hypothetical protein Vafri_9837 [Volvox africanus]